MIGRPTDYTPELALEICEHIAMGGSLVGWCKKSGKAYSAVMRWVDDHPDFKEKYTRARDDQADYLAEDIINIADDSSKDWVGDGEDKRPNLEHMQRDRMRIDTRKWYAGKVRPKKYGEKLALGGADDLPAINIKSTPTDEQIIQRYLQSKQTPSIPTGA